MIDLIGFQIIRSSIT